MQDVSNNLRKYNIRKTKKIKVGIPSHMLVKKQGLLYLHILKLLYVLQNQIDWKLFPKHSQLGAIEKAPFRPLNFLVLAPETFCSSFQIPYIYTIEKAPVICFYNQKMDSYRARRDINFFLSDSREIIKREITPILPVKHQQTCFIL